MPWALHSRYRSLSAVRLGCVERPSVRGPRADLQNVLERALGHEGDARAVADDDTQPLADEVVGNLAQLLHAAQICFVSAPDGLVERVGQAGLQRGVPARELQDVADRPPRSS